MLDISKSKAQKFPEIKTECEYQFWTRDVAVKCSSCYQFLPNLWYTSTRIHMRTVEVEE